jgi:ureidoacrylate peracid hydrolase
VTAGDGTVVVVIDMQNAFCKPGGSFPKRGLALEGGDGVIAEIGTLLETARSLELPVIFTQHVYNAGLTDADLRTKSSFEPDADHLVRGSWDAAIIDELAPGASDVAIEKTRFDAFLGTGLAAELERLGARRLLLCGVLTDVCVHLTAMSAFMRDYEVAVAPDCTTAHTGELRSAALCLLEGFVSCRPWREADWLQTP